MSLIRPIFTTVLVLGISLPSASFAGLPVLNQFCASWQYSFADAGLGETFLLHSYSSPVYGLIPAANAWMEVQKDGKSLWYGYADDNGCTPWLGTYPSYGNYTTWVTTVLRKNGKIISIRPNRNDQWQWFYVKQYLPVMPSNYTARNTYGFGAPVAAVAAVMTHLLKTPDVELPDGSYTVYAEEGCPGTGDPPIGACYHPGFDSLFLGRNPLNQHLAFMKTVVAHEMGHYVMSKLVGIPNSDYRMDAPTSLPLCRCDHVASGPKEHCLQSREKISAAQSEGWGHFYAADLFNSPLRTEAWFAYYKEFKNWNNALYKPPVKISVAGPWRWMEWECPAPNAGTELDWLTFFWALNNRGSSRYSYTDLKNLYTRACGGKCDSFDEVPWGSLQASANALYGSASAKAQYLGLLGDAHGVNY